VAARYCPKCGAPNSASAAFCQYCGAALPAAPASPLPSGALAGAPVPSPPAWGAPPPGAPAFGQPPYGTSPYGTPVYGPPPPVRPKRHIWLWIVVGIVVLFVVIAAIGFFLVPAGPAINVSEITMQSADNACGLANSTWDGFTANASQVLWLGFGVTGPTNASGGTYACAIASVNVVTAGFSIFGANTPLDVAANSNATLQFNVTCPSSSYNGELTLSLT
jgi:zinc-ribbon domain